MRREQSHVEQEPEPVVSVQLENFPFKVLEHFGLNTARDERGEANKAHDLYFII